MTNEYARLLREQIDRYWNLAYAEGVEGRTHDTKDGDAQKTSMEIDRLINELSDDGRVTRLILAIKSIRNNIKKGNLQAINRVIDDVLGTQNNHYTSSIE